METYKTVVQVYINQLDKSKRILNNHNSNLTHEVSELQQRLRRLERDIDIELNSTNTESTGYQDLL